MQAQREKAEAKKAAIGIRTSEAQKQALQKAADAAGRSLSQEIDYRLTASLMMDEKAGGRAANLLGDFAQLAAGIVEARLGKAWNEDAESYFAVRKAIEDFMGQNHPPKPQFIKDVESAQDLVGKTKADLGISETGGGKAPSLKDLMAVERLSAEQMKMVMDAMELSFARMDAWKSRLQDAETEGGRVAAELSPMLRIAGSPRGD